MACGLAIIALIFSIITLIFEALGIIVCFLSLLLPEKKVGLLFSKWFVVTHIGVYFGTLVFYVLHFFIKNYTYDEKPYDRPGADDWKNWKKYDYCYFGIPKSNKSQYPDGNGYSVYWGHIFLFIVAIVGIIIGILYLLPVGIKIFGLLYVVVGFIHFFIVWVVFLSVSVPNMDGASTPGKISRYEGYGFGYEALCGLWCAANPTQCFAGWSWSTNCAFANGYSTNLFGLCSAYPTRWDYGGGVTWEVPKDWAFHGCDNGQEVSETRNFNFIYVISQKTIESKLHNPITQEPLNNDLIDFHRNGYHPWWFTYEFVFFIMMSIFYIGFVLVNFNIDFRGSLLRS